MEKHIALTPYYMNAEHTVEVVFLLIIPICYYPLFNFILVIGMIFFFYY